MVWRELLSLLYWIAGMPTLCSGGRQHFSPPRFLATFLVQRAFSASLAKCAEIQEARGELSPNTELQNWTSLVCLESHAHCWLKHCDQGQWLHWLARSESYPRTGKGFGPKATIIQQHCTYHFQMWQVMANFTLWLQIYEDAFWCIWKVSISILGPQYCSALLMCTTLVIPKKVKLKPNNMTWYLKDYTQ